MNIRSINRVICMLLLASVLMGTGICLLAPSAKAATTTYQLETLLNGGRIKALGRTQASQLGDGITADWTGNGFEANITVTSGDVLIGYNSNRSSTYSAVLVDGVQVWRGKTAGTGTIRVSVAPGSHSISVFRETGHASPSSGATTHDASFLYTTLAFDGTLDAKPTDKSLYIEVIGDSYACGSGSWADYAPGVQWGDADHSAQGSFGWYLSKMLDADLSIVARGGIGLTGGSSQEEVDNSGNMIGIYPYASGHNPNEGEYSFSRQPDLVVIELGANDTTSITSPLTITAWRSQLESLISLVRSKYAPDTRILLLTHKAEIYAEELDIADTNENIYTCYFSHHGNGSAALKSQKQGHPSAGDQEEIAQALYKAIQDQDILAAAAAASDPVYTDITYYVSASGSDSSDGKTIETAKLTVKKAYEQAVSDHASFPAGSRLVLQLQGEVLYSSENKQAFFETTRKTADGKKLPILVTTYDYTDTKAILDTGHTALNDGNGAQGIYNDVTFLNIAIQGTLRKGKLNGKDTYYHDSTIHCGYNNVVFDNVTFQHAVDPSIPEEQTAQNAFVGWQINCGFFSTLTPSKDKGETNSTVIFRNGDYSNLYRVGAVLNSKSGTSNNVDVTSLPFVTHTVIIEEGATMGTVYNRCGTLAVGNSTVEFRGGSVAAYSPTQNGSSTTEKAYAGGITTVFAGGDVTAANCSGTGNYVKITGSVTTEFTAGQYAFTNYYGTGSNAAVTGSVTTRVSGGQLTATNYYGTGASATVSGTVTNELSKGRITANRFASTGASSTIQSNGTALGKVINNISGGELRSNPAASTLDGIYLGGWESTVTGNVENNISGGNINLIYTANVDSGLYLGGKTTNIYTDSSFTNEDPMENGGCLINNISGGNLYVGQLTAKTDRITSTGIYLGVYTGSRGCMQFNNITGGSLSYSACKYDSDTSAYKSVGGINMGDRTVHNLTPKMVNVIGIEGSSSGPRILGSIALGGDKGYLGQNLDKITPDSDNYSADVVIQSTIYSGYIGGNVYGATNSAISSSNYSYVIGSVKTDVYGGMITGSLHGSGNSIVTGRVTTNIYGGSISNIYGARNGNVYGGIETNIYNFTELRSVYNRSSDGVYSVPSYKIYAGGTSGTYTDVNGGPAVKLTVAPQADTQLRLTTPIYAGCSGAGTINGDCIVSIQGGIFPAGLSVNNKTLSEIIPSGYQAVDHLSGEALSYEEADTALTGYVEVVPSGQSSSRELVYYVRPNGNDSDDGLTFVKAKSTVNAAFDQAVADNGGSTVFPNGSTLTIYVDGTVNDGSFQQLCSYMHYLSTEDGKPMESVVTTYKYSDTKATVVHNYAASSAASSKVYARTNITLKDINLMSNAPASGKYQTLQLFAGGRTITFDNASLITNNGAKWIVSADHFATGGVDATAATAQNPMQGTLIFKNGNYLDLNYVTTVNSDVIGSTSATPHQHCEIIIEDGAVMQDVYGPVGSLAVGSSTVEVRGGSVVNLNGTGHGTKTIGLDTDLLVSGGSVTNLRGTGNGTAVTLTGDVNITVSGGTVGTLTGTGLGKYTDSGDGYVKVNGDVNITVTGGTVGSYCGTGATQYTTTTTTRYGRQTITGAVKNTISGGTVTNFKGTNDGLSNCRITVKTVENTITGGTFLGRFFYGAGSYVTVSGDICNTVSGGSFTINPTNNGQTNVYQRDAFFFAGRDSVTAVNVINDFSGGSFQIVYNETYTDANNNSAKVDSGYYFGGGPSATLTNVTNRISGGTFAVKDGTADGGHGSIFMGQYSGKITGTLHNEITGGTFDMSDYTYGGGLYCGPRATKSPVGKIVNIIGDQATGSGPVLLKGNKDMSLFLGSGWGQIGCSNKIESTNDYPAGTDAANVTGTIVIESVIYGGNFPSYVYGAPTGAMDNTYCNLAYGSCHTNIYGGTFCSYFGAGATTVFGHVSTNIYGGNIENIYGARNGIVYDGVELNIYGLDEGCDPAIYAGGTAATIDTVEESTPGIKLVIRPSGKLLLSNTISAGFSGTGSNNGTTVAEVYGGTYSNGLSVKGLTVNSALATGHCVVDDATGAPLTLDDSATSSGSTSVTVLPQDSSLKFSGAALTLFNDLTVSFRSSSDLFGTDGFSDPYAKFHINGQLSTVVEYEASTAGYVFAFHNIAPQLMGDTITATPYATRAGVLYVGKPVEYSVKKYCTNMLTKASSDAPLRTLLVDLLNYGAAAQSYIGHSTDALVNADLTDTQKAWGTQSDPAVDDAKFDLSYATVDDPTAEWKAGGLYLDDRISFRMTVQLTDLTDVTVQARIGGKTHVLTAEALVPIENSQDQYHVYFDQLDAAQMREAVLFTVYRGETAISNTVRYSVECYVASMQNDTSIPHLAELVKSIIRYGDAANAYKY